MFDSLVRKVKEAIKPTTNKVDMDYIKELLVDHSFVQDHKHDDWDIIFNFILICSTKYSNKQLLVIADILESVMRERLFVDINADIPVYEISDLGVRFLNYIKQWQECEVDRGRHGPIFDWTSILTILELVLMMPSEKLDGIAPLRYLTELGLKLPNSLSEDPQPIINDVSKDIPVYTGGLMVYIPLGICISTYMDDYVIIINDSLDIGISNFLNIRDSHYTTNYLQLVNDLMVYFVNYDIKPIIRNTILNFKYTNNSRTIANVMLYCIMTNIEKYDIDTITNFVELLEVVGYRLSDYLNITRDMEGCSVKGQFR